MKKKLTKTTLALLISTTLCCAPLVIAPFSQATATGETETLQTGSGTGSGSGSGSTGTGSGNTVVNVDVTSIATAITRLGNKIESLFIAAIDFVNEMTYAYNPDLPATMRTNTTLVNVDGKQPTIPEQYSREQANLTTQTTTNNSLAQIAFSISPPENNNALSTIAPTYQDYLNKNSVITLTQGIKASDSPFYLQQNSFFTNLFKPQLVKTLGLASPEELEKNNKIFNFGNLIAPTTYTDDESTAAIRFIQYSTKNFRPVTNGINFNKLRTASPDDLYKFVTSPDFQQYQLNTRSQIALRSMAETLLNELVAERTPISENFCIANGKCNVSPLEVQKYIATRRSSDPDFYRNMSVAPPATVLREILFVMVEMQKQNYQAHLDNERIISALAAIAMQNSDMAQLANQENASQLNNAIDALLERTLPANKVGDQGPKNYMPPANSSGDIDSTKSE